MIKRVLAALLAVAALLPAVSGAGPASYDMDLAMPPVIRDAQAPTACTVMFLIEDIANGDLFAQRIRVPALDSDVAVDHRMPCPPDVMPRLSNFAREVCNLRATDRRNCVYADMSREFAARPDINATSANTARCQSDLASHLGAACWMNGLTAICNVGCGSNPAEAIARARSRCEEKQQRACPVSAAVAVTDQTLSSPDAPAKPAVGQ
jgi:hypothetical protein